MKVSPVSQEHLNPQWHLSSETLSTKVAASFPLIRIIGNHNTLRSGCPGFPQSPEQVTGHSQLSANGVLVTHDDGPSPGSFLPWQVIFPVDKFIFQQR